MSKGIAYQKYMWIGLYALLAAPDAYAFSPVLLLDPGFLAFALLHVPLCAAVGIGLAEAAAISALSGGASTLPRVLPSLLLANLGAMAINLAVLAIVTLLTWDTLNEAKHPAIIWVGVTYFGGAFVWIGWKLLPTAGKQGKEKIVLFIVNALGYAALYTFLYFRLF